MNACGIASLSFNLFWVVILSVGMVKHNVNFCDTLVDVVSCIFIQKEGRVLFHGAWYALYYEHSFYNYCIRKPVNGKI